MKMTGPWSEDQGREAGHRQADQKTPSPRGPHPSSAAPEPDHRGRQVDEQPDPPRHVLEHEAEDEGHEECDHEWTEADNQPGNRWHCCPPVVPTEPRPP